MIEVTVKDTGPGLAEDQLDRVFEAFVTTKDKGMGMGLSISRTIVEAHGGKLSASNNAMQGACFTFTLPVEGEA
jgi:two-component system sensor kinase FixL